MHIIAITHDILGDPFWQPLKYGIAEGAKNMGVSYEHFRPDHFSDSLLTDLMQKAVERKPDGLLTTLPRPEIQERFIRKAAQHDIAVVEMNTTSTRQPGINIQTLSTVSSDDAAGGRKAADILLARDVSKALCVDHYVTRNNCHTIRADAFCNRIIEKGGEAETQHYNVMDPATVEQLAAELESPGSPQAVLSLGPPGYNIVSAALLKIDTAKKPLHITFDITEDNLQSLERGQLLNIMDCQQYLQGYLGITFLTQYLLYRFRPPPIILTGPVVISADTAGLIKQRLRSGRG